MLVKALDQNRKEESRSGATFIVAFAVSIIIGLLLLLFKLQPDTRQFHFNPYALLPGIAVLVDVALIIFVTRRQRSVEAAVRYNLLLTCFGILGVSETFQRLSIAASGAMFWRELTIFG